MFLVSPVFTWLICDAAFEKQTERAASNVTLRELIIDTSLCASVCLSAHATSWLHCVKSATIELSDFWTDLLLMVRFILHSGNHAFILRKCS